MSAVAARSAGDSSWEARASADRRWIVDGSVNRDAAWYYPDTLPEAKQVEGFVAFWNGVEVERPAS